MAPPRSFSDEFIPEAEELLDRMEDDLQELGREGQAPERLADRLNALFRSAHSLKGMAGMSGFTSIAQLSHNLEDLMDHLRMGRAMADGPMCELIGRGISLLRALISGVAQSKGEAAQESASGDVSTYVEAVNQALNHPPPTDLPSIEAMGVPVHLCSALTGYEEHRVRETLRMGRTLYSVRATFRLESFDQELGQLSAGLQVMGEVISTVPLVSLSGEDEQEGDIGTMKFEIIFGSERSVAEVTSQTKDMAQEIVVLAEPAKVSEPLQTGEQGAVAPKASHSASPQPETVTSVRSLSDTVRVDIHQLDGLLNTLGGLVLQKSVLQQLSKEFLEREGSAGLAGELFKAVQIVEHRLGELQEGLVEARMVPLGQLFDRLVRAARILSRELGKEVDLRMSGEETRLDKTMIEAIADPLLHLLRNAMDHGIEQPDARRKAGKSDAGQITLRAKPQGNSVVIEVSDDGQGINLHAVRETAIRRGLADPAKDYNDAVLMNFMFQPGFSTNEAITEVSGRGVGLDVVAKNIAAFNGLVDISTEPGRGTTFSMTLPITLVIVRSLLLQAGDELFAIPLSSVTETLLITPRSL